MSIITIKWQGQEGEKPYSRDFEYTGGYGFEIYKNITSLLDAITAIKNNKEELKEKLEDHRRKTMNEDARIEGIRTNLMNESLKKIYEIMGLPKC